MYSAIQTYTTLLGCPFGLERKMKEKKRKEKKLIRVATLVVVSL